MLIKVPVEELERGMYVEELDRPWTSTGFVFQGFLIRTEQEMSELRRHCRHVFINDVKSRLDATAHRRLESALRPFTRRTPISQITFEPWEGETRLLQTMRRLERLAAAVDGEVTEIYANVAQKHSVDPERISVIAAEIYRSLEAEPRIGKWIAQMQTHEAGLAQHCRNVAVMAMGFARHLGLPEYLVTLIGEGALLHDIGLARVPEKILRRPGAFNEREAALVRLHPTFAKSCVQSYMQMPQEVIDIIELHHERLDGGYPAHTAGNPPAHVFVVAICDIFEEMTSHRCYSEPFAPEEALIELDRMTRRQLPAKLVQEFIAYLGIYPRGNCVVLENGAIGVVVSSDPCHKTRPVLRMLCGPGNAAPEREYVDLASMGRDAIHEGWRIVRSVHPSHLAARAAPVSAA